MRDSVETYRVITANRLDNGAVVYMTRDGDGGGWFTVDADATLFPEADTEAMLRLAAGELVGNVVVDAYAIEITGKNKPIGMRESICAGGGPTISVGKGAPLPTIRITTSEGPAGRALGSIGGKRSMPYVKRDGDGRIAAVYQSAAEGAEEQITSDDEELREFLTGGEQEVDAKREFMESDMGLTRVFEDLINLLIEKGVFMFTDLPAAAQQKLLERRGLRKEISYVETLFSSDEEEAAFSPEDSNKNEDEFL